MVSDLSTGFWGKVGITPPRVEVFPMLPSTAKKVLARRERKVIVTTFTALNELRLERPDVYKQLANGVSLVVVDEGHYEPAVEWGKSVKGLDRKTILLTATPYRNDLKLFRIADPRESTHHFTHEQAVAKKVIRKLALEGLGSSTDIPSLSATFAKKWKEAIRTKALASGSPRAIVCCAGAADIELAVNSLRAAGLDAIGVHEQFKGSKNKHLLQEVPDPRRTAAEVWVHQYKLMEGLDDHRFAA
jgi:hypothetical protein